MARRNEATMLTARQVAHLGYLSRVVEQRGPLSEAEVRLLRVVVGERPLMATHIENCVFRVIGESLELWEAFEAGDSHALRDMDVLRACEGGG